MEVKLVHITPDAEQTIAYCARVSSSDQSNPEYSKLLKYCIKNNHWSIFEMANACIEITTSRAIAQQILRHRSFSFQEFSMRYAKSLDREIMEARLQDTKNRQNSFEDINNEHSEWFKEAQNKVWEQSSNLYQQALERGLAKEQARFLLPLATQSKLYMNGNIRSWLHYVSVRTDPSTQKEHREVALQIKELLKQQLPIITKALDW